jgi:hypothetical protein
MVFGLWPARLIQRLFQSGIELISIENLEPGKKIGVLVNRMPQWLVIYTEDSPNSKWVGFG